MNNTFNNLLVSASKQKVGTFVPPALIITQQPESFGGTEGDTLNLSILAPNGINFRLYKESGSVDTLIASIPNYTVEKSVVENTGSYYFIVSDNYGQSIKSNIVNVSVQVAVIIPDNPGTLTYLQPLNPRLGDTPPQINASSTDTGTPITFQNLTPNTIQIENGTLKPLAAGAWSFRINQGSSGVTVSGVVNPADRTNYVKPKIGTHAFGNSIAKGLRGRSPILYIAEKAGLASNAIPNHAVSGSGIKLSAREFMFNVAFPVTASQLVLFPWYNNVRIDGKLNNYLSVFEHCKAGTRAIVAKHLWKQIYFPSQSGIFNYQVGFAGYADENTMRGNLSPALWFRQNANGNPVYQNANSFFKGIKKGETEVITFNITNGANEPIALGLLADGSIYGFAKVKITIDNVYRLTNDPKTDYYMDNLGSDNFGGSYGCNNALIFNEPAGTHAFKIEFLHSGGNNDEYCTLDYAAVLKAPNVADTPTLYWARNPHMTTGLTNAGEDSPGAESNNKIIDLCSQVIEDFIDETFGKRNEICYVEENAPADSLAIQDGLNAQDSTQMSDDGVHPDDKGGEALANPFAKKWATT